MSIALDLFFNYSSDDAFVRGVVCFDWGWRMGKTKFMEFNSYRCCCLPIVEQSSEFCFGRGRHHVLEDFNFRVDWAICWWQEVWRFFQVVW